MRGIKRLFIIFITIFCIMNIFSSNILTVQARQTMNKPDGGSSKSNVAATIEEIGDGTDMTKEVGSFIDIIAKLLGLLRLLTGLLSIIVIAYTGFELVTETPEAKKKIKEKMIPIVTGVVLVFMATTIASFIIGIFENS